MGRGSPRDRSSWCSARYAHGMLCLPTPLNERLAKDWAFVRSYTITDGRLVLLLLADGGHYVFEPMRPEGRMHGTVQGTAASRERIVLPPAAWGP